MLFLEAGIDDNGNRTVVDECNLHVGTEDSALYLSAHQGLYLFAEGLVERNGEVVACSMDIRRAVALARTGSKGKLAHGKHLSPTVYHAAVHHALVVVENAHRGSLGRKPFYIVKGIALGNAHKHHEAVPYLAVQLAAYGHRGILYSLYYQSHRSLFVKYLIDNHVYIKNIGIAVAAHVVTAAILVALLLAQNNVNHDIEVTDVDNAIAVHIARKG